MSSPIYRAPVTVGAAFILCSVGCLLSVATRVYAQETSSSIYGTVTDSKNALVPGVKVTAINKSSGIQRESVTNETGVYIIPLLPAGQYTITAEMPGFATIRITDIALSVSINSQVPIVLQPAEVTGTVSVEAQSNTIDTSNATIASSITNQQVTGLPVMTSSLGRTPLSILPFLVAGVTPTNEFSSVGTSNRNGESMSINGNRTISISYNFEGGDNNDYERGIAASSFPNPDALQEITIITNNYQADTGRSAGGVVNAIARSGSDELHGNARYYRIHESLNARSFFDPTIPRNRLNTFGGQLGGPIVIPGIYRGKNRSHFFFDVESTKSSVGETSLLTVLSDLERAGDFSNLATAQRPRDPRTGQAFTGGLIPAARIDPLAKLYIDRYIPRANEGTRGFRQTLQTNRSTDQFTARIDHQIRSSDTLHGTFFFSRSNSVFDTEQLPVGTKSYSDNIAANLVLNVTHTFSSSTVNQFLAALTRLENNSVTKMGSGADGTDPQTIGFVGVHPQTNTFLSIPGITLSPVSVPGNVTPGLTAKTTWQLRDDLIHRVAAHSLKFGADVRSFIFNSTRGNNNGLFTFASSNTFGSRNTIADFLLGIPFTYSQSTGNTMYPRQMGFDTYALDEWRVRTHLTLNIGVRYELVPPMTDELNQMSVFRPNQKSVVLPNAPVGLLFIGDPDPILGRVPRGGYPADKNNIAPRLGLAYSPKFTKGFLHTLFGERKTAIRMGWGVFFDQPWGGNVSRFQSVLPFSVIQALSASQIANAGGTFANPFGSLSNLWPLDLAERTFTATPLLTVYDPTYRTAYTYQYNLTIQRELPGSLLLNLAYIGSNGFKADRERELNLGVVGPGATVSNLQSRRRYPGFASIGSHESTGRSHYDAFQASVRRRFTKGLAFDVSYWLSKSLDNGSSPQAIGNVFSVGAGGTRAYPDIWARSSFDTRHNLVANYTYDLPATNHARLRVLLNGWRIGGIIQLRSGRPLEIFQLTNTTLTGATQRGNPDLVGPFRLLNPRDSHTYTFNGQVVTGNYLFDPTAFGLVNVSDWTQARAGTLGRNVINGPRVGSWAASIMKRIKIFESHEIELRADINNLLNHADFGFVNVLVDTPTFGQITAASPGRVIQLSARYRF